MIQEKKKKKRSDQEIFQETGREKRQKYTRKTNQKIQNQRTKSQTPGPTEDSRKGILKDPHPGTPSCSYKTMGIREMLSASGGVGRWELNHIQGIKTIITLEFSLATM